MTWKFGSIAFLKGAVIAAALIACAISTSATAKTFRMASSSQPGSEDNVDAQKFADQVRTKTEGRVDIKLYPSSQLGDWVQVYDSLTRGEIDMALQGVPATYDPRIAILTFPMAITDYDDAVKAFSPGGFMFKIVDQIVSEQGVKLIGSWGRGFAGAAFSKKIENPTDPDAKHVAKVRVWPGGTTHYALLERLGYSPATVPWAELYTALQTGVVDGYVGSSPASAVSNFKDVVKMWINLQDHFTTSFFLMSEQSWEGVSKEDQQAMLDVATEISAARVKAVKASDQAAMDTLKKDGAEIVTFTPEQRAVLIKDVRADVWPKIKDEIGDDFMNILDKSTAKPQ